jgi:hypothetical protein
MCPTGSVRDVMPRGNSEQPIRGMLCVSTRRSFA